MLICIVNITVPEFLYNFLLKLYGFFIRIFAFFNPKAAQWVDGRQNILQKIAGTLKEGEKRLWMHCASLGEFEQGRPLLEALRRDYPEYKIVVTFFSPSGYESRKHYEGADYVFYLPEDSRKNAIAFLNSVAPKLILFVKYEFWYHYLHEAHKQNIATLLVSGTFRKEQAFFKWYGGFYRKILGYFTHLLVQDPASEMLLARIGIQGILNAENAADKQLNQLFETSQTVFPRVIVAGDTRYDRVTEIAAKAEVLPAIEAFKNGSDLLIGGSTWPEDEQLLHGMFLCLPARWKLLLAPHEVDETHIAAIKNLFGKDMILYSEWGMQPNTDHRVLVIDNIGMLSKLYRYGAVAFIGGGYNKGGIHNVLEPAVFGLPVMMGPVYQKFVEAVSLVAAGFAFPVENPVEAEQVFHELSQTENRKKIKAGLKNFMNDHVGATRKIMELVAANRWL